MSKIYFASDFHLGAPNYEESLIREKRIISWLDSIKADASHVYLVGDIFDFWFEYKESIPKGFIRFQGKLVELLDAGIQVEFFTGNHDMWMFDYFTKELGIPVHREPIELNLNGKSIYVGHGDGLGPGDYGYKFLKKVFSNKICQWLFARLHPNFGIGLANYSSRSSRAHTTGEDVYLGDDKEWLHIYANDLLDTKHYDYFVFGHRHLPIDKVLKNGKSKYINLGDWIVYNTYAVYDGDKIELKTYD